MPDSFQVRRSLDIAARPDAVARLLGDFREWARWSPWYDLDAALRWTVGETPAGRGATCAWSGNRRVGRGALTISEWSPDRVAVHVRREHPVPSLIQFDFDLRPLTPAPDADAPRVAVVWTVSGRQDPGSRLRSVLGSLDSRLGADLERGLGRLRDAAVDGVASE